MRRIAALAAALLLALACVPAAFAAPGASPPEATELTNRYELLDSMVSEETTDETDRVVTATRIGMLTSVNRAMDGATVSFTGEVVGDIIYAGPGMSWVNLLGTSGASIGVLMSNDDAAMVINRGGYGKTGTTLQVVGVYSVACAEHQGELDVHAMEVSVVDAGGAVIHTYRLADLRGGMILCAVGFLLLLAFFTARRRADVHTHRASGKSRWFTDDMESR